MFDRIINILIIESNDEHLKSLRNILQNNGHNVFTAKTNLEALHLINQKRFIIIFCSLDIPKIDANEFIALLNSKNETKNATVIVTSGFSDRVYKIVDEMRSGAVDYLLKPFVPNLVKAKIAVYKKLYYKHLRVSRLLESILPAQTLSEFGTYGKSSPKKKTGCAVLFTDFVNFTRKTKHSDPQDIVKKLDYYFSKFDEIILKYKLEKIKTIGDAYMAVGGVTETDPAPSIRMALAAIEIRNFMTTDIQTQKALDRDFWEIRIGIHSGDLVAGVVGKHKFSFDVWGDTVNIAARCEQNSEANKINISERYYNEMLRNEIGLPRADFSGLRAFILNKLKAELDEKLLYHSVDHTLNVEKAVLKYAELEKLNQHELFLVQTAALFHDSGFLFRYDENESLAVEMLRYYAPQFGYQEQDISIIEEIIMKTVHGIEPSSLIESVMCDADLDYLGRVDYHITADKLFEEMALYGQEMTVKERFEAQIHYLENHQYYTTSAKNLRELGKKRRLSELKNQLKQF